MRLGTSLSLTSTIIGVAAMRGSFPTGITLSDSEIDNGAAVGDLVGVLFMVGGVGAATFTLTSNPDSLWQIDGDRLEVAASLAALGGTEESPVVKVTDALGQEFEVVLPITIAEAEGSNDSGIGDDDVDVVVPDPEDPDADTGGFDVTPITQDTSDGLKIAGKNGGSATFLLDWGVPVAGATVTMKYDPDWSGMSQNGRQAAVGFAFKSGNNFHLASLRGNGGNPATLLKSKVYGDFRKSNQFTISNDGAASHGTKDGPNWLQVEFSGDGATYTLRSSADGNTWTDEYTAAAPTPLSNATDALQFGPGAYFTNSDKGVFTIVIEQFVAAGFAPVLSSATDTATSDTTADLSVSTTGDDGTLYWVVSTSSTAPSAAQVKAGQDHTGAAAADSGSQAVSATGAQNAGVTGLTAETAYFAHFMHEDAGTNQSNVASGDGFTTEATPGLDFSFVGQSAGTSTTRPVNFGAADPDRYIVVSIAACHGTLGSRNITAVTIGGVAASELLSQNNGDSGGMEASIWIAAVPTGTSGNVVITTSGYDRFSVAAYRLVGLNSTTAHDTHGLNTSTGGGLSFDIPAGGAGLVCAARANTGVTTWSGGNDYGATGGSTHYGAHDSKTSVAGETWSTDVDVSTTGIRLAGVSLR